MSVRSAARATRRALLRIVRTDSFRLTGLYLALFVGSALILGGAIFLRARSALERQIDDRIEIEQRLLVEQFGSAGVDALAAAVTARGKGVGALDYLLQDGAGRHLAGEIPYQARLHPGWTRLHVPETTEDGGRPEDVRAFVADLGGGVLLAVGADQAQVGDLEEAIAQAFGWTVGLAALLGIGGGAMLSRAFLRKVDAIGRTAEAIIAGDLARRIPVTGAGDDLDRLAGTLNRMLDRIAVLMESLRQVSSDVAHDLRTPLSRLYQRLEGARLHASSAAEYETAIDAALAEADGVLTTFSALLRIAQVEGHTGNFASSPIDVAALVETVVDAYRPDAEASGHDLRTANLARPAIVIGDRELLTQAIANLIENAMRHTPPGTRIELSVAVDPEGLEVVVDDDGPGVPAAELGLLTRRFFRAEQSRTSPGNGLGLSLCNAVAELHGGRLRLRSNGPGLHACLWLPVGVPSPPAPVTFGAP